MTYPSDSTQRYFARVAGVAYLGNYLTAVIGFVGMSAIAGSGDFAARATRLTASEPLYRAALTSMAISWVILALQAYALYVTLKPVSRHVARLAGILQGSQAVVGAVSVMFGFAILAVYTSARRLDSLSGAQLQILHTIVNAAYDSGFNIAMLLFAPASLLFFYLFYKSGYLPRALAGVGVVGSTLMILAAMAALIQLPGLKAITLAAWVPMGIAEVTTAFWLAFKGIRTAP
jgi:hypothetical protein